MISAFTAKCVLAKAISRLSNPDTELKKRKGRYIICYHRVITEGQAQEEGVHSSMWISPEVFENQVSWMKSIGEIVSYDRILDFNAYNDRPLFAITFDDGWKDNLTHALPILKDNNANALIFLATSGIDNGGLFWPEDVALKSLMAARRRPIENLNQAIRVAAQRNTPNARNADEAMQLIGQVVEEFKQLDQTNRDERLNKYYEMIDAKPEPLQGFMLNWSDVRLMSTSGISFGSHTHTHRICENSTHDEIEDELITSKHKIESATGKPIDSFAYPNARYKGDEHLILKKTGFRYAFRLHNKAINASTDQFYMPRFISYQAIAKHPEYFKLRLLEYSIYKGK